LEKLLIDRIPHPQIGDDSPLPEIPERTPADLLVAEDNAINQKVIRLILQRLGYRPDIVSNGEEALSMLRKRKYDIVLMDAQMPVMDGLEAMKKIHEMHPRVQDRPVIIVLTAHAKVGDKEAFLKSGMDFYLSKPVQINQLMKSLTKAIDLKKERAAQSS